MNDKVLQHYHDDEQIFVKKITSIKDEVENSGCIKVTDFLTMREQQIVTSVIGKQAYVHFTGGYEFAERKRAIIAPSLDAIEHFDEDTVYTKLFIKYNKRYGSIAHRATLGSILSLGIDRKVIGDIIITQHKSYIVVEPQMADFIIEHLEKIGRTRVELLITSDEIPLVEETFIEKTIFVKSNRLDSILSFSLNESRENVKEFIASGNVQINWQIITNPSSDINEGDVLSIRKFGRIYIDEITPVKKDSKFKLKIRQLT